MTQSVGKNLSVKNNTKFVDKKVCRKMNNFEGLPLTTQILKLLNLM